MLATTRGLVLSPAAPRVVRLDRRPGRGERDRLERGIDLLAGLLPLRHRIAAGRGSARVALPGACGRRRPDRLRPTSGGGVTDPAVQSADGALFAEVAAVPGVTAVVSPYSTTARGRSRVTATSPTQPCSSTDARVEDPRRRRSSTIRTLTDDREQVAARRSRSAGACSRSPEGSVRPSSSASSPPSSSCSSRSARCSRWACRSSPRCSASASALGARASCSATRRRHARLRHRSSRR